VARSDDGAAMNRAGEAHRCGQKRPPGCLHRISARDTGGVGLVTDCGRLNPFAGSAQITNPAKIGDYIPAHKGLRRLKGRKVVY
jgi:hypothetical protein